MSDYTHEDAVSALTDFDGRVTDADLLAYIERLEARVRMFESWDFPSDIQQANYDRDRSKAKAEWLARQVVSYTFGTDDEDTEDGWLQAAEEATR